MMQIKKYAEWFFRICRGDTPDSTGIPNETAQSGQVIILLAFGVVAMLGFAALAIDGGMAYSDRRMAQNAADAAALAGAGKAALIIRDAGVAAMAESWKCNLADVKAALSAAEVAAINRAASNDFTIDQDLSDNNGVKATCYAGGDPSLDVRVLITHQTRTSLIHFVYRGPVVNTVEAIARIWPRSTVGGGNAIISLIDTCGGNDRGTTFDGTSDVRITGGGVFSNSCIYKNGASGKVFTDSANYIKTYYDNGGKSPSIVVAPTKVPDPMNPVIPPPDCSSLKNGTNPIPKNGSIKPGKYTNILISKGDNVTMEPGLYCVSGDFNITGGVLTGNGVTIYLTGDKSDFTSTGNATIKLYAPPVGCEITKNTPGCPVSVGGLLIYLKDGGSQGITLLGDSSSYYEGTVYAPKNLVEVGGTGSLMSKIGVQVIGENIKIHGTSQIEIKYDPAKMYHLPTRLDLAK